MCAIQMKATGTVLLLVTVSYPMHRGCCHFFLDETRVSLSKFGKRIYLLLLLRLHVVVVVVVVVVLLLLLLLLLRLLTSSSPFFFFTPCSSFL